MGIRYVLLVDSEGTLPMNPARQKRLQLRNKGLEIRLSPPLSGAGTGHAPEET
jgi:hypothetical protein